MQEGPQGGRRGGLSGPVEGAAAVAGGGSDFGPGGVATGGGLGAQVRALWSLLGEGG